MFNLLIFSCVLFSGFSDLKASADPSVFDYSRISPEVPASSFTHRNCFKLVNRRVVQFNDVPNLESQGLLTRLEGAHLPPYVKGVAYVSYQRNSFAVCFLNGDKYIALNLSDYSISPRFMDEDNGFVLMGWYKNPSHDPSASR